MGKLSLIRAGLSPSFGFYLKTLLMYKPADHFPGKDDSLPAFGAHGFAGIRSVPRSHGIILWFSFGL